jgi:hypothetical protein
VLCRIEADTPKAPCSVVAEEMGDEAMCSFMKSDCDDYWDRPGRHKIYCLTAHDLRTLFSFFTAWSVPMLHPNPSKAISPDLRSG